MNEFVDSLVIIIVIYNTDLDDSESFQSIRQFKSYDKDINVFVYDNSIHSQNVKEYSGLNVTYFHDSTNSGVSKAYNLGAAHAKDRSKKWILLLDQDTTLPSDFLLLFLDKVQANKDIKLFVPILQLSNGKIFSPCHYRFKRGFYLDSISPGMHYLHKIAPVNSGMLIDLNSFLGVGGYNEKVKLDFSDFQFIERFRKVNKDFYIVNAICIQDFSDNDRSITSQISRFELFCEGAKNCEKEGVGDWLQYAIIVMLRTMKLTSKFGKGVFMKIYFNKFLDWSFSSQRSKQLTN